VFAKGDKNMIGVVVTGISSLLLGILFLYLSISFLKSNNIDLIAGYSSLSDSEKKQIKKDILLKSNGKTLLIISILMILFSAISFLTTFEILTRKFYTIAVIIFILLILTITLYSVIASFKDNCKTE